MILRWLCEEIFEVVKKRGGSVRSCENRDGGEGGMVRGREVEYLFYCLVVVKLIGLVGRSLSACFSALVFDSSSLILLPQVQLPISLHRKCKIFRESRDSSSHQLIANP